MPSPGLQVRATLLVLLGGLAGAAPCRGADPAEPAGNKPPFNEPADCIACHTYPQADFVTRGALDFVLLTEYATWKTQDKHAQAYAVLTGSRGRKMAERLKKAGLPDKVADDPAAGCLNCHAMHNVLTRDGRHYARDEGVSCAGCHGVSSAWRGDHSTPDWRKNTPADKAKLGMEDVRDPARRAALCLSCHVGSAAEGKVVTHAMYAVGHPPLPPIEVALFSKNLPQHWRDSKAVPYLNKSPGPKVVADYHLLQTPEFQSTRQALVGSVMAFGTTLRLVSERGNTKTERPAWMVWPELLGRAEGGEAVPPEKARAEQATKLWPEIALSHSDCYACHHELAVPAWRQERGYGLRLPDGARVRTRPGRVQVRLWSMALLGPAVRHAARARPADEQVAYQKRQTDELRQRLEKLARACDDEPFGNPAAVGDAASQLAAWSEGLAADLGKAPYDRPAVTELIKDLCSTATAEGADYDAARLIASAVKVVYDDLYPRDEGSSKVRDALAQMNRSLDLAPYHGRPKRQQLLDKLVIGLAGPEAAGGMKEFLQALSDLGNRELQEKQVKNPFLKSLQGTVGDLQLTKLLLEQKTIDELQVISDEELSDSLAAVNKYGPRDFLKDLKTVRDHLGDKK
jgi:hypothetical protein